MPKAKTNKIVGWEARRKRLLARRAEISVTQDDVAARGGLTQEYVSKIENGTAHATTYETRARLAKGLRLSMTAVVALLEGS